MVLNATRLYTVEEANDLLPTITTILNTLSEHYVKQEIIEEQLEEIMEEFRYNNRTALRPGWEELQIELEENINHINNLNMELGQLGIEIDDPCLGVVNFNSLRGIETVFLSYRLGEETVQHWHHLDEDFDCRKRMQKELDIIKQ
jgi:hypothetical protein